MQEMRFILEAQVGNMTAGMFHGAVVKETASSLYQC
jgi:hypothetical protein